MNHRTDHLEIRLHQADGSIERFTQCEPGLVNHILNEFQPARIFAREKIILADENSLTSFPARQVVRIDLVSEPSSHLFLPPGIVNAVEFSESEYRAALQDSQLGDRWKQAWVQEASEIVFLNVEMAGQQPLFLALEIPFEPPADQPEAILYPFYPLTLPGLCFRMRSGGVAALNLLHLMRFTLFPVRQPAPTIAWPAHRAKHSPLKHAAVDFHEPADGRPRLAHFQPNGQSNHKPFPRNQHEDESKMERKH